MVLYIFPSELFIVFPDCYLFSCATTAEAAECPRVMLPKNHQRKEDTFSFMINAFFLRKDVFKKCRDTITGFQISPEYRHLRIIPVDV